MNKSIKHILLGALVVGVFGVIEPAKYLSLTTTKTYAASRVYFKSVSLSDGCNINFSDDVYSYVLDVDKSLEEIIVRAKPEDSDDKVKINGEIVTEEDKYRKIVELKDGKNKIELEVRDDNSANTAIYTIYIYRGGKEALYLKDMMIDGNNIGFEKTKPFYNIEVDEDTSRALLNPVTEDDNYTVSVNGTELDPDNSLIKIRFSGIGKYIINVNVKDKETKREKAYILNMYVGIPISPDVSNSVNSVIKPNQWIVVNGRWRYNDSIGECLNNIWFYDKMYDRFFHFNKRGNMQTGWISDKGNWYFLASHGAMQTGWILDDNKWYYLNSYGVMQTGWVESNNKWYFLDSDGAMKTGWILDKGSWYISDYTGEMQTGWIIYKGDRYFLNSDGTMKTGWLKNGDDWYFFNDYGGMKSGEWVLNNGNWYYINYNGTMRTGGLNEGDRYYYLNDDGTMNTSTKIIDGHTYNFNEDGSVIF
ncbi:cadherin-like beta sandwich domain-containing protein [Clostridium uliginosum]|uniref:Glucan-binding domain-containing protein (YG repeat) n=1 Tax=Clostridium uliginosum TaxID=119641 RepID=A0A1I1MTF9_9CLOT|nr:cadherin-like beta sandwich domain-containing protein [Clostridium uliginosum]SFC84860.1 Glucan-binding domain-containing protein (YG repeat) [Clostridium uliginosum]